MYPCFGQVEDTLLDYSCSPLHFVPLEQTKSRIAHRLQYRARVGNQSAEHEKQGEGGHRGGDEWMDPQGILSPISPGVYVSTFVTIPDTVVPQFSVMSHTFISSTPPGALLCAWFSSQSGCLSPSARGGKVLPGDARGRNNA